MKSHRLPPFPKMEENMTVLKDGSTILRLFWKEKMHFIADFNKKNRFRYLGPF